MIQLLAKDVVFINAYICSQQAHTHSCYGIGKVESALFSAFFPGTPPFVHGDIPGIAGALAYYLTMAHAFFDGNKRTAFLAVTVFLELNSYEISYKKSSTGKTEATKIFEECASGKITKNQMVNWFVQHSIKI